MQGFIVPRQPNEIRSEVPPSPSLMPHAGAKAATRWLHHHEPRNQNTTVIVLLGARGQDARRSRCLMTRAASLHSQPAMSASAEPVVVAVRQGPQSDARACPTRWPGGIVAIGS